MPKKKSKNVKKKKFCLRQISKCDTCFYTHFSRAFQKYSFYRSVALVIKKLWANLDFFTHSGLFTALYPTLCIKKITKNPLNYNLWKIKNFKVIMSKMISIQISFVKNFNFFLRFSKFWLFFKQSKIHSVGFKFPLSRFQTSF